MNISPAARITTCKVFPSVLLYFLISSAITCVVIFRVDESLGFLLSILLMTIASMLLNWESRSHFLMISICYFGLIKILFFLTLDPITGPDATRYYAQTFRFGDLDSFFTAVVNDIQRNGFFNATSYSQYGLVYMPFYSLLNAESPQAIAILNGAFIIMVIYLWGKLGSEFMPDNSKYAKMVVPLLFFSSSLSYWSSTFLKDSLSLMLGVCACYFMIRKKYVRCLLFAALAIALRPYAVAYIFCYWVFIKRKYKTALAATLLSLAWTLKTAGILGVINAFPMSARILISPNPLSMENWSNFFLPTIESFFTALILLFSVINFCLNRDTRSTYCLFGLTLLIYACVLTLVGHSNLMYRDMGYEFLSGGDDMFRKKLPFILIIYSAGAYTLSTFRIKIQSNFQLNK